MAVTFRAGAGAGFGAGWPGSAGTNAGIATGPRTAAEAGFGVSSGGGMDGTTIGVLSVGTGALIALAVLWWSLPR